MIPVISADAGPDRHRLRDPAPQGGLGPRAMGKQNCRGSGLLHRDAKASSLAIINGWLQRHGNALLALNAPLGEFRSPQKSAQSCHRNQRHQAQTDPQRPSRSLHSRCSAGDHRGWLLHTENILLQ